MLYLIAGNGSPNFGDELIVRNWIQFYRDNGFGGKIVVDGKGYLASQKLIRGFGDVSFISGIPRHADGVNGSYSDFYILGERYAIENLENFKSVKAFHFLGGGYASANWKNSTRMLSTVANLGERLGVKVAATGMGIAPFSSVDDLDVDAWKKILRNFCYFECRDEESYLYLSGFLDKAKGDSVLFGLDDAFLFPVSKVAHDGKWLHLSGFSRKSIVGDSVQGAKKFFSRFDKVLFWTCSKTDSRLFEELSDLFPEMERFGNERLLNHGLPLSMGDFMITGRFHPHLQAARSGILGYYTANSGFYKTKHGLVKKLGSSFRSMPKVLETFDADRSGMLQHEDRRVEQKQRVGKEILGMLLSSR